MNANLFAGLVTLDVLNVPPMDELIKIHGDVAAGGRWSPVTCSHWQKVAIIVPYRDRFTHLILLLDRLHSLLHKQMISYQIFIIEQVCRCLMIGMLLSK